MSMVWGDFCGRLREDKVYDYKFVGYIPQYSPAAARGRCCSLCGIPDSKGLYRQKNNRWAVMPKYKIF